MANELEKLINRKLMGACNHPSFTVAGTKALPHYTRPRFEIRVRCDSCKIEASVTSTRKNPPNEELAQALEREIPRHLSDLVLVRRVLRHVEANGAAHTWTKKGSEFTFSISKGPINVEGGASPDERIALSSALVKLALALP